MGVVLRSGTFRLNAYVRMFLRDTAPTLALPR